MMANNSTNTEYTIYLDTNATDDAECWLVELDGEPTGHILNVQGENHSDGDLIDALYRELPESSGSAAVVARY